jgi:hypothetical protein
VSRILDAFEFRLVQACSPCPDEFGLELKLHILCGNGSESALTTVTCLCHGHDGLPHLCCGCPHLCSVRSRVCASCGEWREHSRVGKDPLTVVLDDSRGGVATGGGSYPSTLPRSSSNWQHVLVIVLIVFGFGIVECAASCVSVWRHVR